VIPHELAQFFVEGAMAAEHSVAQALRNRSRVTVEGGLPVPAVAGPNACADALVRIRFGLDRIGSGTRGEVERNIPPMILYRGQRTRVLPITCMYMCNLSDGFILLRG